jgi:phospholipid-binding lipoprotein MlaA
MVIGAASLLLAACVTTRDDGTADIASSASADASPGVQLASLAQSAPDIDNPDSAEDALVADPMEDWNRFVFDLNTLIYTLLQPVIAPYGVLPDERKQNVDNFLHNLSTPVILLNDVLQGEMDRAWVTTQRFAINSTAGGLGFFDTAAGMGLPPHTEDFGQTLGVWGVGDGPYTVFPLFGPGNPRDGVGRAVDMVTNPLFWLAGPTGERMANIHTYASASSQLGGRGKSLESLRESSIDFYAAVRSLYVQSRRAAVANMEDNPGATAPAISNAVEEGAPGS